MVGCMEEIRSRIGIRTASRVIEAFSEPMKKCMELSSTKLKVYIDMISSRTHTDIWE